MTPCGDDIVCSEGASAKIYFPVVLLQLNPMKSSQGRDQHGTFLHCGHKHQDWTSVSAKWCILLKLFTLPLFVFIKRSLLVVCLISVLLCLYHSFHLSSMNSAIDIITNSNSPIRWSSPRGELYWTQQLPAKYQELIRSSISRSWIHMCPNALKMEIISRTV